MAINRTQRGFVLLIAVIFTSVMLAFGITLGALGYKQQLLSTSAAGSQDAFYVADAVLECLLYADQQQDAFNYADHSASTPPDLITCDNSTATDVSYTYTTAPSDPDPKLLDIQRLSMDGGAHCADVMALKKSSGSTYLYAQGYNVPCASVTDTGRFSSRGLSSWY